MFKILEDTTDNLLAIKVEGNIKKEDYDKVNPMLEKMEREHSYINLYIEVGDIKNIKPETMWADFKTYLKHVKLVKRVAVLGQNEWEKAVVNISNPFISAKIKYFPVNKVLQAKEWIKD